MNFDPSGLNLRFEAAKALAYEAGELARRRFANRGSFKVGLKGPQDYLTEVDGEVERLIAARVAALFPEDGFVGEEGAGRAAQEGAPIWVVDPIDGTANFAHGAPHFCVSIAAIIGREIALGVIYAPMVGELFAARLGAGATLNGAPIKVSEAKELKSASVEIGWNARYGAEQYLRLVGGVVARRASVYRSGSGALGLAYVAAGRRDGYVEQSINSWDCLAGILLVREAGGYVSDFFGSATLNTPGPLFAAAPGVKDELIEAAPIPGLVP